MTQFRIENKIQGDKIGYCPQELVVNGSIEMWVSLSLIGDIIERCCKLQYNPDSITLMGYVQYWESEDKARNVINIYNLQLNKQELNKPTYEYIPVESGC